MDESLSSYALIKQAFNPPKYNKVPEEVKVMNTIVSTGIKWAYIGSIPGAIVGLFLGEVFNWVAAQNK